MANALLIRYLDVIKIDVDFSDIQNIYDVLNARGVSTIHTEETQRISGLLGIHLMGYVDRNGDDINNRLACKLSGYDYLGSFMLLCKTDNKFNPLPFTEEELECVYTYVTEGRIIPIGIKLSVVAFFDRYDIINPILPAFKVSCEPIFFNNWPNIMALQYNEDELETDEDYDYHGSQLFYFADRMIKEMDEAQDSEGRDFDASRDGKYFLKNFRDENNNKFYVFFEANIAREPHINDAIEFVKGFNSDSNDEVEEENPFIEKDNELIDVNEVEDIPEEALLDDDGDEEDILLRYCLSIQVECKWPDNHNAYLFYKALVPITWLEDENEVKNFPYFMDAFEFVGIDRVQNFVDLVIHTGEDKKVRVYLDQPLDVQFDYVKNKKKPTSHRVGTIRLELKHYWWVVDDYKGKIRIREELYDVTHHEQYAEPEEYTFVDYTQEDRDSYEMSISGNSFFPCLINNDGNVVIVNAFRNDYDDENVQLWMYIPVEDGEETTYIDEGWNEDAQCVLRQTISVSYRKGK